MVASLISFTLAHRRIITLEREADACPALRREAADALARAEDALLERDAMKHSLGILEDRVASYNRGEAARLSEIRALRQELSSSRETVAQERAQVGEMLRVPSCAPAHGTTVLP